MKILFLLLTFPDSERESNLYGDLAFEFSSHGHEVYIATLLEKRRKRGTYVAYEKGVHVLRVRSGNYFSVGFIRKGFSFLMLQSNFLRAIKSFWKDIRFDLVIYPTPPISFLRVIKWLQNAHNSRTYLILRDIFPQNAVDLGIMNKGIVYWYFRRMEKRLYAISANIGCMSPKNIEYLVSHNVIQNGKVGMLPNWRRIRDPNLGNGRDYRNEYGLGERLVAVFGGVIGIAQEVEYLLELAKLYRGDDNVVFLLVGEGNRKKRIEEIIRREKIINVLLKDRLASNEFACLLRQCDIGLINLNRHFSIPNYPSKVLDYFEARIPVLASIDLSTDFGQLLEASGAGLWSLTGDLESYRENFELLRQNEGLRVEMGLKGRQFLENHLRVDRAYNTILNDLN